MVSLGMAAAIAALAFVIGIGVGRRMSKRHTVVWREPPERGPASAAGLIEDPQVDALLREGQLIAAIKRYRELSGLGLKESKDAVEARQRQLM